MQRTKKNVLKVQMHTDTKIFWDLLTSMGIYKKTLS